MGSAKLMASLLTNLRSVEILENLLFLAVEGLGDLPNQPFSEEWVKATQNEISLKEYALISHSHQNFNCLKCGVDYS